MSLFFMLDHPSESDSDLGFLGQLMGTWNRSLNMII